MNKPEVVSLAGCTGYEPQLVRASIERALAPLGGMQAFVKPGARVLLKPNLLSPARPDAAVCTHPEVLKAVARLALECGGKVMAGDSPGLVSAQKVFAALGVYDDLLAMGVEVVEFHAGEQRSGRAFRSIDLAVEPFAADVVINLPKMKTHGMMTLTMGVKNLYGCVAGRRKATYHLHVKESRELFAGLMADICDAVAPALTILDGVVAMEGEGPGSGDPRKVGLVAASRSPVALDLVAAWILGYTVDEVPILKEYTRRYAERGELLDAEVTGDDWQSFEVKNWKRASAFPLSFKMPGWIRRPLRRFVLPSPAVIRQKCIGCGNCAKGCPSEVISIVDGKAEIALANCIRCFCCHELCPVKAIEIHKPLLGFIGR